MMCGLVLGGSGIVAADQLVVLNVLKVLWIF